MKFFDRLSRGWDISMKSFSILNENKQLVLFPILSGLSMVAVFASFVTAIAFYKGESINDFHVTGVATYVTIFIMYVILYFIIVFFNMALIHCTGLYLQGVRPTLKDGIHFSMKRVGSIFAWALLAATVGTILRAIQDRVGIVGKVVVMLFGAAWSIATFFVIPVVAYEEGNPFKALKRSTSMMREKWGESLGAGFGFGVVRILAIFLVFGLGFLLGALISPVAGIILAVVALAVCIAVLNAAETVFVAAIYHSLKGDPVKNFDDRYIDNLFESK